MHSDDCDDGDARTSPITDHTENSPADTGTPSRTSWDLQDENCILSKNSNAVLTLRVFDLTQWKHYCAP